MTPVRPLSILLTAWLSVQLAVGADQDIWLREAAHTIKAIWKEWMEKGDLVYDRIPPEQQPSFISVWHGSFREDSLADVTKIEIHLLADGTWVSKSLRPDMKQGHWYLHDGMILLFESAISETADLAFAIIRRGQKTLLIHADSPSGTVELAKGTAK